MYISEEKWGAPFLICDYGWEIPELLVKLLVFMEKWVGEKLQKTLHCFVQAYKSVKRNEQFTLGTCILRKNHLSYRYIVGKCGCGYVYLFRMPRMNKIVRY